MHGLDARQRGRRRFLAGLAVTTTTTVGCATVPPAPRRRELLRNGAAQVDVIVEGEGPALVLLASSLRDSEDFDHLAALLAARGYRVLRPQARGMGLSAGPMDGLDLNALASDVAVTVRALGGGRAVLVGHAFGHFIARVADLNHPELVRGVVVLGGAARTFPPGMSEALAVAQDPSKPRADRIAALQLAFFAPGNDPSSWLEGWHPALRPIYRTAGTLPSKDRWWPVSHAPILDLQGAADPWRPPSTRNELKDVLGDKVTVAVIDGASHAMVPERPREIAAAIAGWARTLPP